MRYNGIELKEITEPQVFIPPKEMLVWDDEDDHPEEHIVIAILPIEHYPVSTIDEEGYRSLIFKHCAEIPEAPKPRRATNRELAKWLAHGNGELNVNGCSSIYQDCSYDIGKENEIADEFLRVRKWDDTDWHEPTADYLGLEADK